MRTLSLYNYDKFMRAHTCLYAMIFTCWILSFLNESINKGFFVEIEARGFSREKVSWKWLTRLPLDSNNKVNNRNFNWVPRISCNNSHFLHLFKNLNIKELWKAISRSSTMIRSKEYINNVAWLVRDLNGNF